MDHQEMTRLVEQAQNGVVEAFAQIYSEVSKPLYYYALRMTKNEHDAKDIVQETMIEVYKHLEDLKNPGALKAYVNSVAYRRSLNLLSKQKRQQSEDIDEMLDIKDEDDDFIPESYAETQERRDYIIGLVDSLPDAQRTVVLLYYYRQLSSKEIAETLGIEDGAVRARLNRARNTLKQKIQRDEAAGKNGKEKSTALLLAVPVLTFVFDTQANTVFVATIGKMIWESVGMQLGFSAATIAATSSLATSGTAVSAASMASAASMVSAAASAATVATGVGMGTAGIVAVIGVGLISTAFIASVIFNGFNQDSGPEAVQEASGYAQDVNYAPPPPPEPAEEGSTEESVATKAEIRVKKDTLYYSAGNPQTIEQIMADSGVTAIGADGAPADITVLGYDNIDFSVPDDYYVTFEIMDADQKEIWKVVIIAVV